MLARALYYASNEDLDTMVWFFDFQEIKELPRKIQYPMTLRLVLGQVAQSESLNPFIFMSLLEAKKRPRPGSALIYRKMCCI